MRPKLPKRRLILSAYGAPGLICLRAHIADNSYLSPAGSAKRLKILIRLARTVGFDAPIPKEFREHFRLLLCPEKCAAVLLD